MLVDYGALKFLKTKYDSLDGKTTVAFTEQSDEASPFTVLITKSGMKFKGEMKNELVTEVDLQNFARFVAAAWTEHRKLAPKLVTSLTGH